MDERLRAYLESRGLAKSADEDEAWRFLSELNTRDAQDAAAVTAAATAAAAAGAPETGPTQAEIDQIRTAATGEERERVDGLIALGTKYECVELANTLIRDGVLMDLARTETRPRSGAAATALVVEMTASGGPMNRRPRREAAFSVLKSADIPSVLVEIGFLSDKRDLANLRDPVWRGVMVEALATGILRWRDEDLATKALVRQ